MRTITVYTSISLLLMEYLTTHNLCAKLALKTALYPLYYINEFNSWKQAFSYLRKFSLTLFDTISSRIADKNERIVKTLREYIDSHLSEDLTLSRLSELVNYNDSYISRLFKQTAGTGLSDYINTVRLSKAKELLRNTNESMQSIALQTGYDTSQYFSSVFKKRVGVSPSDYRMQNR